MSDALIALAEVIGLQPYYVDAWGQRREVARQTLEAALAALGKGGDPSEVLLRHQIEAVRQLIPSAIILRRGRSGETLMTAPADTADQIVEINLQREDGDQNEFSYRWNALTVESQFDVGGITFQRRRLSLGTDIPLGYHRLHVTLGDRAGKALIIMAPERCWNRWRGLDDRQWGIAVQLYAVRSNRNWGIGDFTDLKELMERAAAEGASAIGVNPLHALFPDEPERASPYSPSTRLYRNPLYLDIEAIAEFARCAEAQELVSSYDFQRELGGLRGTPTVSYAAVAAMKFRVLHLLHATFERTAAKQRRRDFMQFQARQGPGLRRFATYQRLRELRSLKDSSQRDWRNWPVEFQNPESDAVAAFAVAEAPSIDFAEYLQWQIEEQLDACLRRAHEVGLPIGLYGDLAVGVDAGGAEAWWNQNVIVRGLAIGAPPDELSTGGQNWGLPLFNPVTLAAEAFAPFIAVLQNNMRYAGALRIDHVLGLMRLWCVPDGCAAADGVYMTYPLDDLLAITALESHRHRCLIIGEDLGTVPPGFRERLADAGILSYRVLYFERDGDIFRPPSGYPRNALATVATHDLPPLARWWHGDDLKIRASLGVIGHDELVGKLQDRMRERRALAAWAGADRQSDSEPPVTAIHRTMAQTPSRLLMVQLEDMLPEAQPINLPGTTSEYPNWRHKLTTDLSAVFSDRSITDTLAAIGAERPVKRGRSLPAGAPAGHMPGLPRATYRLQFNAGFTFADAERLVPYLRDIGVSHIYASSFFRARPGSAHGYDITDHGTLNPEIGTESDFARLTSALRKAEIGLILDFIPNHMGIGHADNDWWLDVLEWGIASPYAKYFDIDWRSPRRLMRGKVLLPFLGDQYGVVLKSGALQLRLDTELGTFSVWYADHRFPIRPADYPELLRAAHHPLADALADRATELLNARPRRNRETARQSADSLKQNIATLMRSEPEARTALENAIAAINADAAGRVECSTMNHLIERQHYRLAFWRVAADEINYRRFFDINDLAGVRVEDPEVFLAVHRGVARLIAEGAIQGLRLDHIDGLADPLQYLRRLNSFIRRFRPRNPTRERPPVFYLVVEKILGYGETLRPDWPIQGTTGYEFANLLTRLFIDPDGQQTLDRVYADFGSGESFDAIVYAAKMLVMDTMLASELTLMSEWLDRIAKSDLATRDFGLRRCHAALAEIVAGMDIYRTYIGIDGIATEDRRRIDAAAARARRRWRGADHAILDFTAGVLTGDILEPHDGRAAEVGALIRRFQQSTGPVMAKSVEDTAFYRYNRLIALNEVGGDPSQFSVSIARFHDANIERALRWPNAVLGTSTHDTKRGEDARTRIGALSEMAGEWAEIVDRWTLIDLASALDGPRPEPNDCYFLYQTLIGAWPAELVSLSPERLEPATLAAFRKRLRDYGLKAVREAKLHTSWTDGNADYEGAVTIFIDRLLDPTKGFLQSFLPFQARVARLGAAGSIAQMALKLTVPGAPDLYQGAELWNFVMADPDNRRPVDYAKRQALLKADCAAPAIDWSDDAWRSGGVKLAVIRRLLEQRRLTPDLFARGAYRPLEVKGTERERLIAFFRHFEGLTLLVTAGRLMAPLIRQAGIGRPVLEWRDASLQLPAGKMLWRDLLSGHSGSFEDTVTAAALMGDKPIGVWLGTRA